ncbi:MAG: SAM-dependent methyltransferase [Proteobacteria bacterium]|nr:MAG: SAM-dependent methyltransferase [Pseudomonadota bacterium]
MAEPAISNVSDTAFWIAHLRAVESARPDALFKDPLAGALAGGRGKEIAGAMPMPRVIAWNVAVRTVIIDRFIQVAIAEGVDCILNLGAGLDTRPYRMALPPELHWIEADYPHIIEHKQKRLATEPPRCRLERVKIDLSALSERRAFFARLNSSANKIAVVTEGVVPYLSVEQAGQLADDLRSMDRARYWVVDYFRAEAAKYRQRMGMRRAMRNAPFRFAPADWFGFFQEHGWRCRELRYLPAEADRLGRPIPLPAPMKLAMKIRMMLLPKEQRKAFLEFMGYALLEPR